MPAPWKSDVPHGIPDVGLCPSSKIWTYWALLSDVNTAIWTLSNTLVNVLHKVVFFLVLVPLKLWLWCYTNVFLITSSIALSVKCRYLSYLEDDYEFFCLTGEKCCTDEGGIWDGLLHDKFHCHWCKEVDTGPEKVKFLRNVGSTLHDFHEICH